MSFFFVIVAHHRSATQRPSDFRYSHRMDGRLHFISILAFYYAVMRIAMEKMQGVALI